MTSTRLRHGGRIALAASLVAALAPAPALAAASRLVVVPFEEFGEVRAATQVSEAMVQRLARKGYEPAAGDPLEAFFERERVRYIDSLPAPILDRMLDEIGASRVLFGTVLIASERPLLLSVAARMLGRGGQLLWTDVVTIAPDQTGGLLSSRRITKFGELVAEAARQLADRAPDARAKHAVGPRGTGFLVARGSRPVTFRARSFSPPAVIAVLPPTNYSLDPRAPRVVGDLLARRVGDHRGVRVIEQAEIRRAAPVADLRLSRRLDVEDMKKLQGPLGTHLFLRTTVLRFEPSLRAPGGPAHVALEMTLVDSATERIVWTAYHERRSDEYSAPFRLDPVRDVVTLADHAIDDMVNTLW